MFNLKHNCEALSRDITRKRPRLTCYLLIGASASCGIDASDEWRSGDRVWRFTPYNHYLDGITLSSVLAYFRFQLTVLVVLFSLSILSFLSDCTSNIHHVCLVCPTH